MVSQNSQNIQERLQQLLQVYGSQSKLAKSLGVNQSQISRYLKGTRNPSQLIRDKISKRFSYQTRVKETIKKELTKPSHKKKSGKHTDGRKFVRFEFSLWRRDISDTTKIPELFKKLRFLYNSVKSESPHIKAQRLGLAISTDARATEEIDFYSKKAKRKYTRKKEELDFITTIIYARNVASTDLMFEELAEKIYKYLMRTLASVSLHEEQEDREAKTFFVFFEDESVEY